MKYQYPQVIGGYRWNIGQRVKHSLGIEPLYTHDVVGNDNLPKTEVVFSRNLTPQEKVLLDSVMVSSPSFPPVGTAKFVINDLWEQLAQFNAACGLEFHMYFSESVPGSGRIDQIELHRAGTLTNSQRNKVKTEFSKILRDVL